MMLLLISLAGHAQNAVQARKVLDKTARLVGRKGGASADFAITSSKYGNQPSIVLKIFFAIVLVPLSVKPDK